MTDESGWEGANEPTMVGPRASAGGAERSRLQQHCLWCWRPIAQP